MSYEERVQNTYATDDPISKQAFGGFDCMKDEAKKIAREADAELADLRERLAAAEADGAAMREALGKVVLRLRAGTWRMSEVKALAELIEAQPHPGAALLARATAAEAVVEAARKYREASVVHHNRPHHDPSAFGAGSRGLALDAALATYDARVQEGK